MQRLLWARVELRVGLLLTAVGLGACTSPFPQRGPEGFGDAKFGMTVEKVRQLYPAMKPAPAVTAAAYFNNPNMARFVLTNVEVSGLKQPVGVELRFWKGKFWTVIIYFGGNPFSDVVDNLTRLYGEPSTHGKDPSWLTPSILIVTAPAQVWYSLNDRAIGADAQRALMEALQGQRPPAESSAQGQTPAAADLPPTPGTKGG